MLCLNFLAAQPEEKHDQLHGFYPTKSHHLLFHLAPLALDTVFLQVTCTFMALSQTTSSKSQPGATSFLVDVLAQGVSGHPVRTELLAFILLLPSLFLPCGRRLRN